MKKTIYKLIIGLSNLTNLLNAQEINKVPYYQIDPNGITSTAAGQRDLSSRVFFFNSRNTLLNPDGEITPNPLRLTNSENYTFSINLNHNPYNQPIKKEKGKIEVLLSQPHRKTKKLPYCLEESNRISGELDNLDFKPKTYDFIVKQAGRIRFKQEIKIE